MLCLQSEPREAAHLLNPKPKVVIHIFDGKLYTQTV